MSQLTAEAEDFARMLRYVAHCIEYTQTVKSYHSCSDCAGRKEPICPYLPEEESIGRINCPLWYKEKRDAPMKKDDPKISDIWATFSKHDQEIIEAMCSYLAGTSAVKPSIELDWFERFGEAQKNVIYYLFGYSGLKKKEPILWG